MKIVGIALLLIGMYGIVAIFLFALYYYFGWLAAAFLLCGVFVLSGWFIISCCED